MPKWVRSYATKACRPLKGRPCGKFSLRHPSFSRKKKFKIKILTQLSQYRCRFPGTFGLRLIRASVGLMSLMVILPLGLTRLSLPASWAFFNLSAKNYKEFFTVEIQPFLMASCHTRFLKSCTGKTGPASSLGHFFYSGISRFPFQCRTGR